MPTLTAQPESAPVSQERSAPTAAPAPPARPASSATGSAPDRVVFFLWLACGAVLAFILLKDLVRALFRL
jgi:hypothetical protein